MNEKLYVLQGDWLDNLYDELITPSLTGIPIANHHTLSITRLGDSEYWENLRDAPPEIASLDFRHWHYDNQTFFDYAKRVADSNLPAVRIFDCPYGFERLPMDIWEHHRKVYERTKVIVNLIRQSESKTQILSPFIRIVPEESRDLYLRYFTDHRNDFDAYSFDGCFDLTDHAYGLLTTFLHRVMKVLHKPVWAFLSVPSCEHFITSSNELSPVEWKPVRPKVAASKMIQIVSAVERMCSGFSTWFFLSSGRDFYHPQRRPVESYWQEEWFHHSDTSLTLWDYRHFVGLLSHDNKIKGEILRNVILLHARFSEEHAWPWPSPHGQVEHS
jgi:hypothetical protein